MTKDHEYSLLTDMAPPDLPPNNVLAVPKLEDHDYNA